MLRDARHRRVPRPPVEGRGRLARPRRLVGEDHGGILRVEHCAPRLAVLHEESACLVVGQRREHHVLGAVGVLVCRPAVAAAGERGDQPRGPSEDRQRHFSHDGGLLLLLGSPECADRAETTARRIAKHGDQRRAWCARRLDAPLLEDLLDGPEWRGGRDLDASYGLEPAEAAQRAMRVAVHVGDNVRAFGGLRRALGAVGHPVNAVVHGCLEAKTQVPFLGPFRTRVHAVPGEHLGHAVVDVLHVARVEPLKGRADDPGHVVGGAEESHGQR
mmetsp:Transcript_17041/g.57219  ORF Transcript_17041/g.57219 Transcript_17041/m.57219 type:complete len:273 (-) Transcript_17041:1788-2606(-)